MTRDELNRYVAALQRQWPLPLFLARSFRTDEQWSRWASNQIRARATGDGEPHLEHVLNHNHAIILGEAGSGKSAVARKAIELAAQRGHIPLFAPLKSYSGSLTALLAQHLSDAALQADEIDGTIAHRVYIFDGLDEIPSSAFASFIRELNALVAAEPDSRVLLTSRQAFFVDRQRQLTAPFQVFHVLDFSDDDVDVVLSHAGVDRVAFRAAADHSHLSQELGNPLALDSLVKLYQGRRHLGHSRSDALQHVVDSALESRPTSNPRVQKRALRMLAVAMEVAARNELTEAEALAVLERASRLDTQSARTLLDELTQSVLVRTPNGYTFQLHSYGEYLAAEELSEMQQADRILSLIYIENTRRPSDSWRNTLSYLIERHAGIRSLFSRRFPDWTLTSSPDTFAESDRTAIVEELLASLIRTRVYLINHPTIRAIHLARFVPAAMVPQLRAALDSQDDVESANAALLLAVYGDRLQADRLLDIGLDETRSVHFRHSALSALDHIGDPAFVPRLLDIQDWDAPMVMSRVDAAAGLMDASNAGQVLAALGRTDAMISSAYYRFYEINDAATLEAVLDALAVLPLDALQSNRLSSYLDRFWLALGRAWRTEWAAKVAAVLFRFEAAGNPDDGDLKRSFLPHMRALPDHGAAIGRHVLEQLLETGRDTHNLYQTVAALVSPADARWLAAQQDAEALVRTVRAFGSPETADALRLPVTPEQQRQIDRWRQEEQQRQARRDRLVSTISTSEDERNLLSALARLDPAQWPALGDDRRSWLATFVGDRLIRLDLRTRIRWTSETQLTQPQILPLLLALVKRYELPLADDEPLSFALLSETDPTRTYHQRFGLSARALAALEDLLEAPDTPNPGLDQILSFIRDAELTTPRIAAAVEHLAEDGGRPTRARDAAIRVLARARNSDALLRVAPSLPAELRQVLDDFLVEAQHRGTIERRLQQLLDDPNALASGEVDIHFNNPLNWVGTIREPQVWTRLVALRRLALQRSLNRVATLLVNTLAEIDMMEAASVIDRQINDAPQAWQPYLRRRAIEMRRDATIIAAQGATFDGVLRRLAHATSLNLFKIWVEGPTDCEPVETLLHKLPGRDSLNIVTQSLGGWGTILSPQWSSAPLGYGCLDFVILLDGDRAYDYTRPGLVHRADARDRLRSLERERIDVTVLERHGLENYFSREAFETALGRDLGASFPLNERRPVRDQLPGYDKNMNTALARNTTLADLVGTDLRAFLERVARLAGD